MRASSLRFGLIPRARFSRRVPRHQRTPAAHTAFCSSLVVGSGRTRHRLTASPHLAVIGWVWASSVKEGHLYQPTKTIGRDRCEPSLVSRSSTGAWNGSFFEKGCPTAKNISCTFRACPGGMGVDRRLTCRVTGSSTWARPSTRVGKVKRAPASSIATLPVLVTRKWAMICIPGFPSTLGFKVQIAALDAGCCLTMRRRRQNLSPSQSTARPINPKIDSKIARKITIT
jgi:hypothetical protein